MLVLLIRPIEQCLVTYCRTGVTPPTSLTWSFLSLVTVLVASVWIPNFCLNNENCPFLVGLKSKATPPRTLTDGLTDVPLIIPVSLSTIL